MCKSQSNCNAEFLYVKRYIGKVEDQRAERHKCSARWSGCKNDFLDYKSSYADIDAVTICCILAHPHQMLIIFGFIRFHLYNHAHASHTMKQAHDPCIIGRLLDYLHSCILAFFCYTNESSAIIRVSYFFRDDLK